MSQPVIKEIQLPKKAFTALDLKAWISSNYEKVTGSYIDNVFLLPSEKIFLIKLRTRGYGVIDLLLQPAVRVHFTEMKIVDKSSASPEVTRIRQLIRDKKIIDVRQVGFDRLLEIVLHDGFKIIVELLPRGELIITDEENVIRYSSEYREMKDRKISIGIPYQYPPLVGAMPSKSDCIGNPEVLKVFPRDLLLEARSRGNDLCVSLWNVISEAIEAGKGYIVYQDDKPVYFSPFRPTFLEKMGLVVTEMENLDKAIDVYFYKLMSELMVSVETRRLQEAIDKLAKTIESEKRRAEEYLEKAMEYKRMADSILLNREWVEEVLDCAKEEISKEGWESLIHKCKGIIKTQPNEGKITIKINDVEVVLDVRLTTKELVTQYYDQYKKYKQKHEKALQAIADLENKIKEQKIELEKRTSEVLMGFRKTYWYERYVWSFTRNKLLIIAGRDSQQNESLVRKYLEKNDLFFHADIQGAAATILKITPGVEPKTEDIHDASVIAACFSKAWKAGLASIDVFYVTGEQVSKTPPSGEYIVTGSFMIYGKKNYVKNVPLQLAFGVEIMEGYARFTIGSEDSVKQRGDLLGYLLPGENPPSKIAERIRKRLREVNYRYIPSQSEIEKLVPGPSKIKFIV
jgi:predicted ribosome quality control (RQC) complex YloA/Tae2 family protein